MSLGDRGISGCGCTESEEGEEEQGEDEQAEREEEIVSDAGPAGAAGELETMKRTVAYVTEEAFWYRFLLCLFVGEVFLACLVFSGVSRPVPQVPAMEPLALSVDQLLKRIQHESLDLDAAHFPSHVLSEESSLQAIREQSQVLVSLVEKARHKAQINWTKEAEKLWILPLSPIPAIRTGFRPCDGSPITERKISLVISMWPWREAQRLARELGGQLLVLPAGEPDSVGRQLRQLSGGGTSLTGHIWVGATSPGSAGPWTWAEAMGAHYPFAVTPSRLQQPVLTQARCLSLDALGTDWFVHDCTEARFFLVEVIPKMSDDSRTCFVLPSS